MSMKLKNSPVLAQKFLQDFPGLEKQVGGREVIYLDNAATTLKPRHMLDRMVDYYLGVSSNIHRGKHFASEDVSNKFEEVRRKIASLIGCSGNEIVFQSNTTEALNLVAKGLSLTKSDKVVCFSDSHHSNILPWMDVADTHFVDVNSSGEIDIDMYRGLLQLNPKVVSLTHCSNVTGVYIDLEYMVGLAKDAGAIVVVDGAQSVPHRRLDVSSLGIDFLAFSAHKMLGPTGLGILYGKSSELNKLKPLNLGGGMVDSVSVDNFMLRKIPHRFEAGTPNIAGVLGFGGAIDYILDIGYDIISEHDTRLGRLLLVEASKRDYIQLLGISSEADRGAIISFSIRGLTNLDDLGRYLSDSYGVMCRSGYLCAQPYVEKQMSSHVLRVSAYIYNTEADINYFFNSLDSLVEILL